MKTRASVLILMVWAAIAAHASIPPQPKSVDVVQALAQQKSEWTRINGWNYKFQLLDQRTDATNGVQKATWCVTAASRREEGLLSPGSAGGLRRAGVCDARLRCCAAQGPAV